MSSPSDQEALALFEDIKEGVSSPFFPDPEDTNEDAAGTTASGSSVPVVMTQHQQVYAEKESRDKLLATRNKLDRKNKLAERINEKKTVMEVNLTASAEAYARSDKAQEESDKAHEESNKAREEGLDRELKANAAKKAMEKYQKELDKLTHDD